MTGRSSLTDAIERYYSGECFDPYGRHESWEHCHAHIGEYLKSNDRSPNRTDSAALHLAFFLASWGMYRGSSFMLKRTYKIHVGAIDIVENYSKLRDIQSSDIFDQKENIIALLDALKNYYKGEYANYSKLNKNTKSVPNFDMLTTKIALGALGCFPAIDTYVDKAINLEYPKRPRTFQGKIETIFLWLKDNIDDLAKIDFSSPHSSTKSSYPVMKLADMYFWQMGRDLEKESAKI